MADASGEVQIAFEWISAVLSGDSTLSGLAPGGVWPGRAAASAQPVYVAMIFQAGADSMAFGSRAQSSLLVQVRAVGKASQWASITAAANRIDTLLSSPQALASPQNDGTITACYRFAPLQLDEIVDGEAWTNWGGIYRLYVQHA